MDGSRQRQEREMFDADDSGAIKVGARPGPEAEEARRLFALTLFVRVVALLWIAQALEQWLHIIAPAQGSFANLTPATMTAMIFFAVLDPIAAVGLWLLAPWGGVVWLLTLVAQFFVASFKPSFFLLGGPLRYVDALLFLLYLFLSWRAASLHDEPLGIEKLFARVFGRRSSAARPGFFARLPRVALRRPGFLSLWRSPTAATLVARLRGWRGGNEKS